MGHLKGGNFGEKSLGKNDLDAQVPHLGDSVPQTPLVYAPGYDPNINPPDPEEWYSEHFQLKDLIVTSLPYSNLPLEVKTQDNLTRLAHLLDLIWDRVGSFAIASAFRSAENQAALASGAQGGDSAGMAVKASYHSLGIAADITPTNGMSPQQFAAAIYTDPEINKLVGQIVDKAEGNQTSLHISLQTPDKFPKATLMYVGDDKQYYRMKADEVQSFLASFSNAASETIDELVDLASLDEVKDTAGTALTMTGLALAGYFLYNYWSKNQKRQAHA